MLQVGTYAWINVDFLLISEIHQRLVRKSENPVGNWRTEFNLWGERQGEVGWGARGAAGCGRSRALRASGPPRAPSACDIDKCLFSADVEWAVLVNSCEPKRPSCRLGSRPRSAPSPRADLAHVSPSTRVSTIPGAEERVPILPGYKWIVLSS